MLSFTFVCAATRAVDVLILEEEDAIVIVVVVVVFVGVRQSV